MLTERIKCLSYGFYGLHKPNFHNLTSLLELVILDLSKTGIVDICTAFQTRFDLYDTLLVLQLQQNNIKYLSPACFSELVSLRVMDLHDNPLVHIDKIVFQD